MHEICTFRTKKKKENCVIVYDTIFFLSSEKHWNTIGQGDKIVGENMKLPMKTKRLGVWVYRAVKTEKTGFYFIRKFTA